jgi:predicted TIM-barrel fold metal-dependent hydrolase
MHTLERGAVQTAAQRPIRSLADAHFHLFNFVQATDGLAAAADAMDEARVDHAMVNGMAVCKKWSEWDPVEPKYYLDDDSRVYPYSATDMLVYEQVMSLPEAQRIRFHPFICGFDPTDRNAIDHVKRMLALFPGFWQGIGEVFARHDDLTALMYGEPGRANHVALDPVYDLAAELDLPVSVHSDITSVWGAQQPIYLAEMTDALRKHPETKIIWCHAGISRRLVVPTLIQDVRTLLSHYPKLHVDLSWVLFDQYLVVNGAPSQDWLALIEEFPDRFMVGSDVVGSMSTYVTTITRYYVMLDALKPATAEKVARTNFLDVLPKAAPSVDRRSLRTPTPAFPTEAPPRPRALVPCAA